MHETVVIPTSYRKQKKLCQSHRERQSCQKHKATQYFAFSGRPARPAPPPLSRLRIAGGPSDPPALGAPGLAFGAPGCASNPPPLFGPFCALRVWQKFSHFQFETGFPRVALNNLGTKSGATRFALGKPCLPCKHLFGRPKCIININEPSTL